MIKNNMMLYGENSYVITAMDKCKEVFPNNGTDFSLEEMQAIVGGYIEIVYNTKVSGYIIVANEEGHLLELPYNMLASAIAGRNIVGDVLICPKSMVK